MNMFSRNNAHKEQMAQFYLQMESHAKAIADALEMLGGLVDTSEGDTWVTALRRARTHYAAASAQALKLMEENRQREAVALMNAEALPALDMFHSLMKTLLDSQKKNLAKGNAEATQKIDSALTMLKVLNGAPKAAWQAAPGDS